MITDYDELRKDLRRLHGRIGRVVSAATEVDLHLVELGEPSIEVGGVLVSIKLAAEAAVSALACADKTSRLIDGGELEPEQGGEALWLAIQASDSAIEAAIALTSVFEVLRLGGTSAIERGITKTADETSAPCLFCGRQQEPGREHIYGAGGPVCYGCVVKLAAGGYGSTTTVDCSYCGDKTRERYGSDKTSAAICTRCLGLFRQVLGK